MELPLFDSPSLNSTVTRRSFAVCVGVLMFDVALGSTRNSALAQLLQSTVMEFKLPAMGGVIIRNGRIQDIAAIGVRRLGQPERAQVSDAWMWGSCGKPMTTTLIARLVDRGVLSWTTPLDKMLPELSTTMLADYRTVTLLQLLSHQSGLPRGDELPLNRFFTDRRALPEQRMDFVALALQEKPVSEPGTAVHYSNAGFMTAAAIAEKSTGRAFEELLRKEVFQPLGIFSAAFSQPEAGQLTGHRDGRPATPADSGPALYSAAGLFRLSLKDWARFALDQLAGAKGNGRILSRNSYRLMQSPLPGIEDALTWGFDASFGGRKGPVLSHTGTDENWYASVNLFPEAGDAILLVTNAGKSMGGVTADESALKGLLPSVSVPA